MVTTLIALVLFIIPFLAMGFFNNKKRGFIYVLFFLFSFHTALAFLTQLFGIFYYSVILGATILADVLVLAWFFYVIKFWQFNFKQITNVKMISKIRSVDWMLLAVIMISVLSLYQVHYNYTGKMSLTNDLPNEYHNVNNMKYPYPYFSDEWYAVSLINSSTNSHHLPFNILNNSFFLNLEVFSHSFLAQISVIFGA